MAKKHTKKKVGARAGAKMHKLSGAALAAHRRAQGHAKMHAAAGAALGKHAAKKKRKAKKHGKKKSAKKSKGAGKPFRTKVQVGRRKVVVKAPAGATVMEMGIARKDKKGRKHVKVVYAAVGGRHPTAIHR